MSVRRDDEIDLIGLSKTIWANKRVIYKTVFVFFILGLVIAFGSKVEYEASCKLLPNNQEDSMPDLGGLGGLAGLAGIDLNFGNQGIFTPELYPEIVQSLPFQMKVLNERLTFAELDTTISSFVFFKEIDSPSLLGILGKYTLGLPGTIKKLFYDDNIADNTPKDEKGEVIKLTEEEDELLKSFEERITIDVNASTGIITLTAEMPDPVAAAELAKSSVKLLQAHIIDYRISKAEDNLKFIKERREEAKDKFEQAQENLARFSDRNLNVVTASAQTEQQRLQNEYNLAFEMYKSLATQTEQAEIKVKEETPVFTIIEPAKVPLDKHKPQRRLILFVALMAGAFLGVAIIVVRHIMGKISQLNEVNNALAARPEVRTAIKNKAGKETV